MGKRRPTAFALLASASFPCLPAAALVGLAGLAAITSPAARATAELDQKYALETIGALRSWDNVDGLFADYVAAAYKDYFARQGRFRAVDLAKADALLSGNPKIPYAKAIEDREILAQLARSMRAQSLLRTRVRKEGPQYRFAIEWLHSPGMDALATEELVLNDPAMGDVAGALKGALDRLFRKVPFLGQVTGRDEGSVTLNVGALQAPGAGARIQRGDTVVVGTLDDVKKHPLLKQVVDWRLTPTGRLEVEQVDESIAFCRVVDEEEGRQIGKYQKILQVIPRPVAASSAVGKEGAAGPDGATAAASSLEPPRLGFARASLIGGSFSRQFSSQGAAVGYQGSGFLYGARGEGQLWFNRELFADLELGYGGYGYSQSDIATGVATPAGGVSGGMFTFKADIGYSYLLSGDFFGPKGWIKAGYLINSYSLPISAAESTAPFSVKSVFVGLGGEFPVRDGYGAKLDLEFGLFNSASETGSTNGDINSANNARIRLGGYYRYQPRITFEAGIEIQGSGAEFSSGNSLSQKAITLMPSVSYYF